mmetsp:Transcript_26526/g.47805  ORF Transcript_26526/g.47805 Transcript_26526/m.47805 type:complete len:119 (+) Transcript_26526:354-710(+)
MCHSNKSGTRGTGSGQGLFMEGAQTKHVVFEIPQPQNRLCGGGTLPSRVPVSLSCCPTPASLYLIVIFRIILYIPPPTSPQKVNLNTFFIESGTPTKRVVLATQMIMVGCTGGRTQSS